MQSREEKKRQTRQSLIDAALLLMGQGGNFASISLREVAKNAGVVPTSFYRHFNDMDELGLCIVDDFGLMLRRLMRSARQERLSIDQLIGRSVELFCTFAQSHPNHLNFIGQCRTGNSQALRQAIQHELNYFVNELASDLQQFRLLPKLSSSDLTLICQLLVGAMIEAAFELLNPDRQHPQDQQIIKEATVRKLQVIWQGAQHWPPA